MRDLYGGSRPTTWRDEARPAGRRRRRATRSILAFVEELFPDAQYVHLHPRRPRRRRLVPRSLGLPLGRACRELRLARVRCGRPATFGAQPARRPLPRAPLRGARRGSGARLRARCWRSWARRGIRRCCATTRSSTTRPSATRVHGEPSGEAGRGRRGHLPVTRRRRKARARPRPESPPCAQRGIPDVRARLHRLMAGTTETGADQPHRRARTASRSATCTSAVRRAASGAMAGSWPRPPRAEGTST